MLVPLPVVHFPDSCQILVATAWPFSRLIGLKFFMVTSYNPAEGDPAFFLNFKKDVWL